MTTRLSLKQRLVRFLQKNHGWFAKEELVRIAQANTTYSSENISVRLRELERDGILTVKIIKGHAHYQIADQEAAATERVRRFDAGLPANEIMAV